MNSPTTQIDDVVHQRHRLGILVIASEVKEVEFTYLRDALSLTAGNLNRHLAALEEHGLVSVRKEFSSRKPKTWIRITKTGSSALSAEMDALEKLVSRHRSHPTSGAG